MLHLDRAVALIAVSFTVAAASCSADRPVRSPAAEHTGAMETVHGEIIGVERTSPEDRLAQSIVVTVQPPTGDPVTIDLAPGWFLDENGLRFEQSDVVRIDLVPAESERAGPFMARRVRLRDRSLDVRDARGRPTWKRLPDRQTPVSE